ncbi:hypothetical protein SLE2022_369960 [Rubroshorea leprosula]
MALNSQASLSSVSGLSYYSDPAQAPASYCGKTAMQENEKDRHNHEELSGFIFMCNGRTKPQCYQYRVFGLPAGKREVLAKIKPGMKLFLYDFEVKLLYGIYEATSSGQLNLEEAAFSGRFPAQVRFKIYKDCLPLLESSFRQAIEYNYQKGTKFSQELNKHQVSSLLSLFRPLVVSPPNSLQPMPLSVKEKQSGLPFPGPQYAGMHQHVRQKGLEQHDCYRPLLNTGHAHPSVRHQTASALKVPSQVDTNGTSMLQSHVQPVLWPKNIPHGVLPSQESHHANMTHTFLAMEPLALPTTSDQYYGAGTNMSHAYPAIASQPLSRTSDQYYPSEPLQAYVVGNPAEATAVPLPTQSGQSHSAELQQPYVAGNPTEAMSDPYTRYWTMGEMVYSGQQVDSGYEYHLQPLQKNVVTYYHHYPSTSAPNPLPLVQSQVPTTGSAPAMGTIPLSYSYPCTEAPSTTYV